MLIITHTPLSAVACDSCSSQFESQLYSNVGVITYFEGSFLMLRPYRLLTIADRHKVHYKGTY